MTNAVKPLHLLAGGRSTPRGTNDSLIRCVLRESGKKSPSIGYVGTANGDNRDFFNLLAGLFRKNGAGEVRHALLVADNADIFAAKEILAHSDLICIGGGDVDAGMQKLKQKRMVHFLDELYRGCKPFFGLSAGSIMLAQEWIRWRRPDDDATAEPFPCLGLAPLFCDTHDEDSGWVELAALLKFEKEGAIGYGIPAGAALRVFPDGRTEALGGAVHRYVSRSGNVERISDLMPASIPH